MFDDKLFPLLQIFLKLYFFSVPISINIQTKLYYYIFFIYFINKNKKFHTKRTHRKSEHIRRLNVRNTRLGEGYKRILVDNVLLVTFNQKHHNNTMS